MEVSNVAVDITNDKGLQPSENITITFTYRDSDIVGFDKTKLIVGRYDDLHSRWLTLPSTPYASQNKVAGTTNHLCKFAISRLIPSADLNSVKVYPNPLKLIQNPGGVIIDNLTITADIKIYTIAGELVREVDYTSRDGRTTWDGRNRGGNAVGRGVYLIYIKGPTGTKTLKLAVQ